jgi:hypothetical protein
MHRDIFYEQMHRDIERVYKKVDVCVFELFQATKSLMLLLITLLFLLSNMLSLLP